MVGMILGKTSLCKREQIAKAIIAEGHRSVDALKHKKKHNS